MTMETCIWIDEKSLMASFHSIQGFRKNPIENFQKFIYLIQKLVEAGYRFQ